MGAATDISWTERTWNYLRGCSEVSTGCANCYARLMAARMSGPGQPYEGLGYYSADGKSHWTGKVLAVPDHLDDPIRWQRPSLIFVNSMSDIFHPAVEWNALLNMYEVMEAAHWHIFQPLTKRPERMAELVPQITLKSGRNLGTDPLPNVWHGVSMEDEATAKARSKHLAATPSALRWWSAEPLVGNCDWKRWIVESKSDWVVFGGESRQGTEDVVRRMEMSWLREGIAACRELNVTPFVKQLGYWLARDVLREEKFKADPSGKKPDCWPGDIVVQEWPIDVKTEFAKWDGKHHKTGRHVPLEVISVVAETVKKNTVSC